MQGLKESKEGIEKLQKGSTDMKRRVDDCLRYQHGKAEEDQLRAQMRDVRKDFFEFFVVILKLERFVISRSFKSLPKVLC